MTRTGVVSVAVIVPTPELVAQMLREKPACWTWAVFASVAWQRWADVEERKIIQVLGVPVRLKARLHTGREVAQFVGERMRAVDDLVAEVGLFLGSMAFLAAFGTDGDEDTADGDAIVRAAHQLGDYYERLLQLAESCRTHSVPAEHAELMDQCMQFMNQPLQDYGGLINDILERLESLQMRVMSGQRRVPIEPVPLQTTTDDRLLWSIMDRLQAIE